MTNTPDKKIIYKTARGMTKLADRPDTQTMLARCIRREHSRCTFWPSKLTNPGTVAQWGETYRDTTGFRASIFYFAHEDGLTIRSVQRIVTDTADFRLGTPPATPTRNLIATVCRGFGKFAKKWSR